MGQIAIVTDSTADMPAEFQELYDIRIVPLNVHFEDEVIKDYIDIDSPRFFERLSNERVVPRTSQPAPGEFLAVYHDLRDKGYEHIVSVHISQKLSGTYQSADVAAKMAEGVEVRVVDSHTTSGGLTWCAVEGARAVQEAKTVDEVVANVREAGRRSSLYFVVDTLKYLEKNGRIGRAQAFLGGLLRFKPVLTLDEEGTVGPVERLRGKARRVNRLYELFEEHAQGAPNVVTVLEGAAQDEANKLRDVLADHPKVKQVNIASLGPVIGCHVGPGVIGVCFYEPLLV